MAGKAGSQIEDEKQEYQFSVPWITPSGHELSFYDTPENQRLVLKHTSGSHIEFKTDGSVFIKAIKDLHVNASVASEQQPGAGGATGAGGSDASTMRFEADLELEVQGTLKITANKMEIDVNETTKIISGTDMILTANNIESKANENIALEATKSIYVDTKEYRERSVSHRTEEGTMETGGASGGGLNYMNVNGNFVINNTDPMGGITLMSAGYLNLVCGQERVDVIGKYVPVPSALGIGTFTTQVYTPTPPMPQNKSVLGDYIFASQGGASYTYAMTNPSSTTAVGFGLSQVVTTGNMNTMVPAGAQFNTVGLALTEAVGLTRNRVVGGAETVTIGGIQKVTAAQIYLN
tara:strand:- start:31 stop:1080 length:1050 start_codon:yes stop_codon:yes gene_type:complete